MELWKMYNSSIWKSCTKQWWIEEQCKKNEEIEEDKSSNRWANLTKKDCAVGRSTHSSNLCNANMKEELEVRKCSPLEELSFQRISEECTHKPKC